LNRRIAHFRQLLGFDGDTHGRFVLLENENVLSIVRFRILRTVKTTAMFGTSLLILSETSAA
jgi:hypothetical protein